MSDHDQAVRSNQKAAKELASMKAAMDALTKLREAGVAKGVPPLRPPHSGRYDQIPQSARQMKGSVKTAK